MTPLLRYEALTADLRTPGGPRRALEAVSFEVGEGRAVGLVGESGSGKTITALCALGLCDRRAFDLAGAVRFRGEDVLGLEPAALQALRGGRIALVPQDPLASLNPSHRVGAQVAEGLRLHRALGRREAWRDAVALLARAGVPDAAERAHAFAHQLSGGLRQRVLVAMALAGAPELLVADEPTSALDPTVQRQILDLLDGLRAERGLALLLVSHDLGLVAERCDEVVVLYAGRVMERGPVELLRRPLHPYTAGLLDAGREAPPRSVLPVIPGGVPQPGRAPSGCVFRDRCAFVTARCEEPPPLVEVGPHAFACHHPLSGTREGA
jgi:oligopeptide/dipeptide ABC transporter ATP-binding protein